MCHCLDPTVRDSSAEAIGTAMKVAGEKAIMPYLVDLEAIKLTKIKEYCDKAVVIGKPAGVAKPKAAVAEAKEPPKAAEAPKRAVIKKPTPAVGSNATKKTTGKVVVKKASVSNSKAVEEKNEKELSDEEVEEKAASVLPPDVVNGMIDSNWKTRLGAMESMIQVIQVFISSNFHQLTYSLSFCRF